MNPEMQQLLEYVLARNIVFMLFFGTLFPVVSGLTVKRALTSGLKFALVLALVGTAASFLFALLPQQLPFLNPVVVVILTVAGLGALVRWGELGGDWGGIPRGVFFMAPLAGVQVYLWKNSVHGLDAVMTSFGSALGFYCGLVLIVSLIEQIRISESPEYARRLGTLFFSIAIVALGLAGFSFL